MSRALLIAFTPEEVASCVSFGIALGLDFEVLLLTGSPREDLGSVKVRRANLSAVGPAEGLAESIATLASGISHIASVSSMRSKDVLARLAGVLGAAMVTDVEAVESASVFRRPIFAGSVVATVEVLAVPVVMSFRPAGFRAVAPSGSPTLSEVTLEISSRTRRVSQSERGGARPALSQAKVVVSGGRPLKDAETFVQVIGGLADALGGAVGATRAAVDAGIVPNELQVGQTGKIVAPDLYIAAGISGSTQHMAGIKDSKIIVAINKDADAPIFQVADYGLVADLYDAVPKLQELVESKSA